MPLLQLFIAKIFDIAVRSLPQKAAWLRRVIIEATQRELMTGAERSRSKDGEV
jgi:hypothetical protein